MLNITTFLDANARRLDKDVLYCPNRDLRYNSTELLKIVSGIGQSLKDKNIEKVPGTIDFTRFVGCRFKQFKVILTSLYISLCICSKFILSGYCS